MTDTIFALSSGSPPAAIAVVRISGPDAGAAVGGLAGKVPEPRQAKLATLRDNSGNVLDRALVLWFPGPNSVTGEDLAELHCHGGRAVVAAVEAELRKLGLRRADPGEFTRRAFSNGRIDLAEAEGLADLLSAETELQRQAAIATVGGILSQRVEQWRGRVLELSAEVEAALDFSDEDDVTPLSESFFLRTAALKEELRVWRDAPTAERLRDGVRVVFAGPPNAGKSSLFNALLNEGAAIVSAEAGTTRDVIERPIAFGGVPFVLVDTAGLREEGAGEIEAIGIGKARRELDRADIVLWLGDQGTGPVGAVEVAAKSDLGVSKSEPFIATSAETGSGVAKLIDQLIVMTQDLLPKPGAPALNQRVRAIIDEAIATLGFQQVDDPLLFAEQLRQTRRAFDRVLGRDSTEEMLDGLFGRFCIGK